MVGMTFNPVVHQESNLRILVIDPDHGEQQLQDMFAGFGVQVCTTTPAAARLAINDGKYDGIFLDMGVDRSSLGIMAQLRTSSWNRTTPIIAMSDRRGDHALSEAFRLGASFYMEKPIDRARLRLLLNSARGTMLENRRLVERAPLAIQVQCASGDVKFSATSCNISARGILLRGAAGWGVGDQLRMTFQLPRQWKEISTSGLIVRIDQANRAGISFTGMRLTDRQRIKIYVGECLYGGEKLSLEPAVVVA